MAGSHSWPAKSHLLLSFWSSLMIFLSLWKVLLKQFFPGGNLSAAWESHTWKEKGFYQNQKALTDAVKSSVTTGRTRPSSASSLFSLNEQQDDMFGYFLHLHKTGIVTIEMRKNKLVTHAVAAPWLLTFFLVGFLTNERRVVLRMAFVYIFVTLQTVALWTQTTQMKYATIVSI